ncbi:hypothetical protein [Peredibacter starrii]|uniref:Uncharacterized protein n=1 Tax=Peredibacter starrii TaxID=28202 RepID=A0AAX4HPC9_9BACT|nr:hypothetical protein [Peredibacter starrii]WPU65060.1 hypothetical protein SOO65_20395 [Peredibacter starrii]
MKFLFALLSLILTSGVFAQDNQQRDAEAIAQLMKVTKYLADSDLRCAKATDCKLIPVGARACGGPSGYMITSQLNANMTELEYLAAQTEAKQAAFNRNYNIMSICSLIMPPELKCIASYCR